MIAKTNRAAYDARRTLILRADARIREAGLSSKLNVETAIPPKGYTDDGDIYGMVAYSDKSGLTAALMVWENMNFTVVTNRHYPATGDLTPEAVDRLVAAALRGTSPPPPDASPDESRHLDETLDILVPGREPKEGSQP
jgi:hypothetical protein